MDDSGKSQKQLIEELEELRQQVIELRKESGGKSNSEITEGKHLAEKSRLHEKQLKLIYNSTGTPLFFLKVEPGPHYRFLSVNASFLRITGLREEQIVGKTTNEVIPKPSLMLVHSNYEKAIREQRIISWEETSQYPTGLKTGIVSIVSIFNKKGSCTHLVGSVVDVTERRRAEEKLRESEEKFRRYIGSAPDGVFVVDAMGNYVDVNQAACDLTGYTQSELTGMSITDIIDSETIPVSKENFKQLKRTGIAKSEFKLKRKDGSIVWTSLDAVALSEDQFMAFCSDITERKQAEQKMRDMADIVESSLNEIYIFDAETFLFVQANHGARQNLRYTDEELTRLTPIDIKPEFSKELFVQLVAPLKQGDKKITIFETIHERKDGSHYNVEVNLQLSQFNGRAAFVAIVIDITERKQAAAALKESEEKYRVLFERDSNAIFIYDPDTMKIIDANEATSRMYGFSRDELIGMSCLEFSTEVIESKVALEKMRGSGEIDVPTRYHRRKDGTNFPVDINGYAITLSGKNMMFAVSKDITERKRTEDRERLLLDNLPCIALILKKGTREIVASNNAAYAVGATPGATCYGTCAGREDACEFCGAPDVWETSEAKDIEVEHEGVWSHGIWVSLDDDLYVHYIFDITKRKKAEQALNNKTHDLEERMKELGGLYGLSLLVGNPKLSFDQVCQRAVELLPPAWHYPDKTCGRIVINQQEFTTANYIESVYKQTSKIISDNSVIGFIEVAYLEEMPPLFEGPFMAEERSLIDALARALGLYVNRLKTESELKNNHARLIESQIALENKNTTLSELVEHVEREKEGLAIQIRTSLDRVIGPVLARLEAQFDDAQIEQLAIIRSAINDMTSPFIGRLEQGNASLSPREVEICNLIKNGYSSKDVAHTLSTSESTVKTQRKVIRRKLGLIKSKDNLATFLKQLK